MIRRARTAEEPGRVQIIPDCLSRLATTCLQAPSTAQRRDHRARKRKALNDLLRYLRTNEEQMRYDLFRARGENEGNDGSS